MSVSAGEGAARSEMQTPSTTERNKLLMTAIKYTYVVISDIYVESLMGRSRVNLSLGQTQHGHELPCLLLEK